MKIVVLDAGTLGFDASEWNCLDLFGSVQIYDKTSADAVSERIKNADVILTNKVKISGTVLNDATKLKLIAVMATGYNIIDIKAARARAISVANVPDYAKTATAQHAIALILELCNRVGQHSDSVNRGDWLRSSYFSYWHQAPCELASMTVGIVGMGAIGRAVALTLRALGAGVIGSARSEREIPELPGFRWASNQEIFEQADLVTLHCPETSENRGFVNAGLLAKMKTGSFLVNTARGGLIDEKALADAFRNGPIAGAAVDVLSTEPMKEDCPLLGLSNCLITPHMAWASLPARRRLLESVCENIQAFCAGRTVNIVNS